MAALPMARAADQLPRWLSCHQQFRAWRDSGLWERINVELVPAEPSSAGPRPDADGSHPRFAKRQDGA